MITIHDRSLGTPAYDIERIRQIAPATVGHLRESGFMSSGIKALISEVSIAGPAVTARIMPPDGSAVHHAIDVARPGSVLVVDTGGDSQHACWGDGTSLAAQVKGIAGAIIDGAATDVQALRRMRFPVFARALSTLTTKAVEQQGEVNGTIQCGGVAVSPGDLILADDNGVLVIAPSEVANVIEAAEAFQRNEETIFSQIRAGRSLVDIVRESQRRTKGGQPA